jgi:hypothetical protein
MSQKVGKSGGSYNRPDLPGGAIDTAKLAGKAYKGSWDCLVTTLKHEGLPALYRGFLPAWLRMGPWNLIFFTTYEQLLRLD